MLIIKNLHAEIEGKKMAIEWGSQIRNYVLQPYKLVKDVRTNHESTNPDAILDGYIDGFLKAYLMMMGQEMLIGTGYRGDIPTFKQI